jgi:hypothetical protein
MTPHPYELPYPDPQLSPRDVVKIQLDALQNNDLLPNDEGIRLAFEYASPINRKSTGSLNEFIRLLKDTPYRTVIGFERAVLDTIYVSGTSARQAVQLLRGNNTPVNCLFVLSRQTHGKLHPGCWLTDALLLKNG